MKRRRYSIRTKLLLTHLFVAFLALSVTGLSFFTLIGNYTLSNTYKGLVEQVNVLRDVYQEGQTLNIKQPNPDPKTVAQIRRGPLLRVARQNIDGDYYLVSIDGLKVLESNKPQLKGKKISLNLGNSFSGEEFRGRGMLNGSQVFYVANSVRRDGRPSNEVLVVTTAVSKIQAVNREIFRILLQGFLFTLIAVLVVVLLFVRSLLKPFKVMIEAVRRLAQRDFSQAPILQTRDEWEELSTAFHQMVEELRQYNEGQRRFLQHASHELKTPLMSIQGYAEGIRDGVFQGDEVNEGLEVIRLESKRLKRIVDELIYLSKLETLDEIYQPERIDLAQLVPDAISRIGSLTKPKGVSIRTDHLDTVYLHVDPDKLTQALLNLLSNALRHARKEVGIGIYKMEREVKIRVWDDGSGIDESERERIFDRFYKGNKGDTGLGLAITRAIVEKSGGVIEARNQDPEGALFEITLPLQSNYQT